MDEIIFRLIEEDDIPRVNTFYNQYHQSGRTLDQFRWEFRECPHGKGIYCLAVVAKTGQIIGIQAGIPIVCVVSENKTLLTVKSEDTLIDVDLCASLKKKHLFHELYAFFLAQCRERGAVSVWGFTWAKNSLKRIGFQIPFDAAQGLMVIHPAKSYHHLSALNPKNNTLANMKIGGLVIASWILGWRSRINNNFRGLTVAGDVISNESLFSRIAQSDQSLAFIKQDADFLNWRIKKNPYPLHYEILNFSYLDQPVAQIITSLHPNGQGFLEQLLLVPGFSAALYKKIVTTAIKSLSLQGAIHIRVLTFSGNQNNIHQESILKSAGFTMIKKGMGFIFLSLNDPPVLNADQFLLSRLYTQGHN